MSRTWWWVIGVAVVLIVGGVLARPHVMELLGMAATGGERILREPMRPPAGGPRVLVFALDGVGDDELMAAIRAGRTPALASVLGAPTGERTFEHGYAAAGVLSILPSTTLAAWSTVFTGETAAHTGVPGNEWFVREEMRYYAPAPVSVEGIEDALASYTDNLIGSVLRVPTVYERADVRAYVSLSHVHRGADLLVLPALDAFGDLVTAAVEGLAEDGESVSQEGYIELDLTSIDNLTARIDEHGLADLQVVYFPGVDLYTHVAEDPIPLQRGYVAAVIDSAVARVLDVYREAGALDDTWVLFVSDHGHTPVLNDDRHALEADGDDEPTAVIEQAGFRLRALKIELDDDEQDFQATVAYQGAFAYVYLADRSTCADEGDVCDWRRAPRLEEDVLPVVRAFDAANRTGAGVPELRGTLDLILAREPRPTTEDALPFQVWDGARLVPVSVYLAANPRPDLVDFERRLQGLGEGPYGHRAGDVLLMAKSGASRPIEERFYFSGWYRSWHGSADMQDSNIPLVLAHAGRSGAEVQAVMERYAGGRPMQEDVTALVLGLLGRSTRAGSPR